MLISTYEEQSITDMFVSTHEEQPVADDMLIGTHEQPITNGVLLLLLLPLLPHLWYIRIGSL